MIERVNLFHHHCRHHIQLRWLIEEIRRETIQ